MISAGGYSISISLQLPTVWGLLGQERGSHSLVNRGLTPTQFPLPCHKGRALRVLVGRQDKPCLAP